MQYFAPDVHLPGRLGDTRDDWLRWRQEALAVRYLPDYKLRKLWRMNFSVQDIANNKHYAVFPQPTLRAKRAADKAAADEREHGLLREDRRGRTLAVKTVNLRYAQALLREAKTMLRGHRHEPPMLERLRSDIKKFAELVDNVRAL